MTETKRGDVEPKRDMTYAMLLEKFKSYGLELTMSEASRLRRILQECRKQQKEVQDYGQNGFEITSEAETRFFQEAFGIDSQSYFGNVRTSEEYKKRMRDVTEYIRTKIRGELEML